jgi:hypothetical protein
MIHEVIKRFKADKLARMLVNPPKNMGGVSFFTLFLFSTGIIFFLNLLVSGNAWIIGFNFFVFYRLFSGRIGSTAVFLKVISTILSFLMAVIVFISQNIILMATLLIPTPYLTNRISDLFPGFAKRLVFFDITLGSLDLIVIAVIIILSLLRGISKTRWTEWLKAVFSPFLPFYGSVSRTSLLYRQFLSCIIALAGITISGIILVLSSGSLSDIVHPQNPVVTIIVALILLASGIASLLVFVSGVIGRLRDIGFTGNNLVVSSVAAFFFLFLFGIIQPSALYAADIFIRNMIQNLSAQIFYNIYIMPLKGIVFQIIRACCIIPVVLLCFLPGKTKDQLVNLK